MSDNNNDPIKSYGRNRLSRMFEDDNLSGETENKYEYDVSTENVYEWDRENVTSNRSFTINEYGFNRKRGLSIKVVFFVFMIIWSCVLYMAIYSGMNSTKYNKSSQEKMKEEIERKQEIIRIEKEANEYDFSKLNSISFDNGITIPTIYKYLNEDRNSVYEVYTYSDKRFGSTLTTIEVRYLEAFSEEEILQYKQALERRYYEFVRSNTIKDECMYVKNIPKQDAFVVVVIGEKNAIYGIGSGDVATFLENMVLTNW